MQIHEVFGLDTLKAMTKDPGSFVNPTKFAQAKQAGYAAGTAKAAEKLTKQGYGQPTPTSAPSQMIAQVKNDPAAQQLINTWASQWPSVAAKIAAPQTQAQPAASSTTASPSSQPLSIGGQSLDPNNPADAKLIAQLKAQGKLTEDAYADTYRASFSSWADSVIERTIRQPGMLDKIKTSPNWSAQFKSMLDQVVATANDPEKNETAVKDYMSVAISAARAAQKSDDSNNRSTMTTSKSSGGIYDPQAEAIARVMGINAASLAKLNTYIKQSGEKINPNGTGSASLDALLRSAKLLK